MKALLYSCLTVSIAAAGCQSKEDDEAPQPPTADFSYTGTAQNFAPIAFTSTAAGAETYAWEFGDAGTSTLPNPSHTFRKAGTYTVTLRTTSAKGPATVSQKLTLAQADTAALITEQLVGTYYFTKVYRRIVYNDKTEVVTPLPAVTLTAVRAGSTLVLGGSGRFLRESSFKGSAGTIKGPGYSYYAPSRRWNDLRIQYPGDSVQIVENTSSGNGPTVPYSEEVYIGVRKR